ncbi:MAG TPA: AAA family ATPase [Thermoanaerobaculia bacterium]
MTPRIRQIQIQGFKSIDRAVVDLEPFTVLVGLNGTGKSNFLEVLEFVRDCLTMPVSDAVLNHGRIFPFWLNNDRCGVRLLIEISENVVADYAFLIEGGLLGEYRVAHERCLMRVLNEETGFETLNGSFVREIPGIRPQLASDRLALFAASAIDDFRSLYDFLNSMSFYDIDPYSIGTLIDSGPAEFLQPSGRNAAAVLKALQELAPESHSKIERLLSQVVDGIQKVTAREVNQHLFVDFQKDIGLDRTSHQFAADMSDGTLRILGLLLAVYQLKRPTVLAFEEPEATIHPGAAELVTQVLMDAAQDRQVLITTHSPDVLDSKDLRDEQIRVVTMERGRTIIAPLAQSSRQAIREHLYTPGELLRIGELWQDVEAAKAASERLDLFPEPASTPS